MGVSPPKLCLYFSNQMKKKRNREKEREGEVIIPSLKNEPMGKLINRIPGSHLLISSLPGSASRKQVKSLGKPPDATIAW